MKTLLGQISVAIASKLTVGTFPFLLYWGCFSSQPSAAHGVEVKYVNPKLLFVCLSPSLIVNSKVPATRNHKTASGPKVQ